MDTFDTPTMISPAEQSEFILIVQNAKNEGWLEQGDCMSATPVASAMVVKCTRAGEVRQREYPKDPRWLYALLRDLAHGIWRSLPPATG